MRNFRKYDAPRIVAVADYSVKFIGPDHAVVEFLGDGERWTATVKRLLADGDQNPKTALNNVETRGLSLVPHTMAGIGNACPWATTCIETCLSETGQGTMDSVRRSRIAKYVVFRADREWFVDKLNREIASFGASLPAGAIGAIRLNMFSDIAWERYGVIDRLPHNVVAYDYAKDPRRAAAQCYCITYSYDGTIESEAYARELLSRGVNVAVCFYDDTKQGTCGKGAAKQDLPATFLGYDVIDGTSTDYRPDDARGVVVGLKLKSRTRAKRQEAIDSGFAVSTYGEHMPLVGHGRPMVAI